MTVIEEWTGRHAHALRTALRLTNEAFAERLGISPRTATKWRERPEMVVSPHLLSVLVQASSALFSNSNGKALSHQPNRQHKRS